MDDDEWIEVKNKKGQFGFIPRKNIQVKNRIQNLLKNYIIEIKNVDIFKTKGSFKFY